MAQYSVSPSTALTSFRQHRQWLLALLLGVFLLAQSAVAWHDHGKLPADNHCGICLQLSAGNAAITTKPLPLRLHVASFAAATLDVFRSFYSPIAPRSRAPPVH